MPKESIYQLKTASAEDWKGINDLYHIVAGRHRSQEQFDWEWKNNPYGTGNMWIICHKSCGEIIGHHGMIPLPLSIDGKTLLAGKTENTMVHPNHRGKFFYSSYERKAFQEAKKRYQTMFTTAGKGAPGAVRRRLGYEAVGSWCLYVLNYSSRYRKLGFLNRFKSPVLHNKISAKIFEFLLNFFITFRNRFRKTNKVLGCNRVMKTDEFIESFSSFWKKNNQYYDITVDRNSYFLKWRIKDNPYNTYELYEFVDNNRRAVAYAILRAKTKSITHNQVVEHFIDDLIVQDNDPNLYKNCINLLIQKLTMSDILTCRTVYVDNSFNKALKSCQIYPWKNSKRDYDSLRSPFLVYYNTQILNKKWFITELMTEGVL